MIRDIDAVIDTICNPRYALVVLAVQLAGFVSRQSITTIEQSYPGVVTSFILKGLTAWSVLLILYYLQRALWRSRIDWTKQIAIVTGSSGGLGKAIVAELEAKGCRVIGVDVEPNSTTHDSNKTTFYTTADVSDVDQVKQLPAKVRATFGGNATIVISNAGIMVGRKILDFDEGQFERTISVNLLATYHLVRAFLPDMLSSGQGHIVATSSIMAYISVSQLTDYTASKHALVGFMESLRFELDKKYKVPGISTTLLILGKLATPLFARTNISAISSFLTPTQDPHNVACALIDQLDRCQGGTIYRPHLARLAPLLKAMPSMVRRAIQWASGADEALQLDDTIHHVD